MVEKCIDCYFYPSCMCNFHFQYKLQTHFYFSHSYPIHWPSCPSATLKTPSTTGEAKFAARDLSIHLFSTPLTLIIRVAADPAPADFTWRDGNTMDRWPAISHHSEQRAIVTVKLTLPPNKFPCTKKYIYRFEAHRKARGVHLFSWILFKRKGCYTLNIFVKDKAPLQLKENIWFKMKFQSPLLFL